MVNKKISDGVGKKIVEALKKQSEIEINSSSSSKNNDEFDLLTNELDEAFVEESKTSEEDGLQEDSMSADNYFEGLSVNDKEAFNLDENVEPSVQLQNPSFTPIKQPASHDNFITELDNFEIPSNIAVLKKLITQLPSGVTRHTGAQIIKQTMEALGISMKSVLQEAQQVQDGLNNSAKECYSTIQEYKKQILLLEKQAQNHQKQYAALNELISLFVQTSL